MKLFGKSIFESLIDRMIITFCVDNDFGAPDSYKAGNGTVTFEYKFWKDQEEFVENFRKAYSDYVLKDWIDTETVRGGHRKVKIKSDKFYDDMIRWVTHHRQKLY